MRHLNRRLGPSVGSQYAGSIAIQQRQVCSFISSETELVIQASSREKERETIDNGESPQRCPDSSQRLGTNSAKRPAADPVLDVAIYLMPLRRRQKIRPSIAFWPDVGSLGSSVWLCQHFDNT